MKYIIFVLIFLVCVMGIADVHAHGSSIALDAKVGDYIADVDYDAMSGIYAGTPVQFTFQLFNKDRSEQIDFNTVWVSMMSASKGEFSQPVFDGGIIGSSFPPSTIAFAFPAPGAYTLTLRFEKGDKTLGEVSFPLDVLPGEVTSRQGFFQFSNDVFKGALGVGVIWFIIWIVRKKVQKKTG